MLVRVQVNEAQQGVSITWTGRGLPLASGAHQTAFCFLASIFCDPMQKPIITKVALGTQGCELGSDRMGALSLRQTVAEISREYLIPR